MMRMLMAAMVGSILATGPADAQLDAYRWQKRLLLVFTQGDETRAHRQTEGLGENGLRERDLVILRIPISGTVSLGGAEPVEADGLRRRYGVAPNAPFTVLLVGKDGGVKLRSLEPVSERDLFETIDAMPMRARELR